MGGKVDFRNLPELVVAQLCKNNNNNLLNFKVDGKWKSFSSLQLAENSVYLALAFNSLNVKRGTKFAIYSYQNPIWLIVDFACQISGLVSVPIFHNISKKNLIFQLKNCNVKNIFVDNQLDFVEKNHFNKLDFLNSELPEGINNIISYNLNDDLQSKSKNDFWDLINRGCEIYLKKELGNFEDLVKSRNVKVIFKKLGFNLPKKDELATIVYTSGSTGNPKGVELSHDNLVSQVKGAAQRFKLNKKDRALSFLPLAHIFERMVMMFYISRSVAVFFVDDVTRIGERMQEVQPTIMTVVPRLLEKLFAKIKDKSNSGSFLKRKIAICALNKALLKNVDSKKVISDKLFEKIIYKKYRQALGGKMKFMICGGAALSEDMERFYRNIGIDLFCGYGLTETSPVLAVNYKDNYRFGTVGKIYPDVKLKIAKDGELLARGRGVMKGYHNSSKKNEDVMERGWFKTGDLAQIDNDGFVKITGRKKELFKTSAGKYVMPVPIEQKLVQELGFLTGAIIMAEGKNFVSTLLFPDFETLGSMKSKMSYNGKISEFLDSNELQKFVSKKINHINKSLDRSNQIMQFRIVDREISISTGEITPSMKLKRSVLEKNFRDLIDSIYAS